MKKYLITGAMALLAGFYLTSCTHDDIEYSSLYEEKTQSFEKVFKDLYGTIDPNHDWGFTPYVFDGITTTNGTRALTRGVNPNGNEWANEWVVPDALTAAQKDKVRRWFQQHKNPQGVSFSYKDFFVQQVYKGGTNTTGSESPEKYTAANGGEFVGSQHMDHLTCGTYGEGATTEDNDGRNFYDHVNNFNNGNCTAWDGLMLMVDSRSDAFGYYNSNGSVGHNLYVIIPGNEIQEWDSTGGSEANVSNMYFVGLDFEQIIGDNIYASAWYTGPDGNKYHYLNSDMNQYCGQKETRDPEPTGTDAQKLLDDGYLPVDGSANKTWVKLASCADGYYSDWIVRVIPGTKKSSGGDQEKEEEEHSTSNKYTAKRHVIVAMGRIFVEDLYNATRADIDYNDAVFDGIIWCDYNVLVEKDAQGNETYTEIEDGEKKFRVEIALLAAGGTIPMTIAGSKFGDVHNAFGVGLTTIVNTVGEASNVFGSMVTGKDYVYKEFDYTTEINAIIAEKGFVTLNDIPVDVEWITGDVKVAARLNNKETHTYQKDEEGRLVVDANGDPIVEEAGTPVVPHVIQVPIGTAWAQERVNIGLANEGPYHLFPSYVSNHNVEFWKSDVDQFYLYADNRSPLAYSDKLPGYAYLTDIQEMEGITLWEGNLDFGNSGIVSLATDAFTKNNAKSGDKIRFYLTSSATNYWNNNGGHYNENEWDFNIFTGYEQGYKDGSIYHVYGNSADISKGYYEFTPSDEDIAAFKLELNLGWTPQASLKIQGYRFVLTKITLVQ